jgi:hypothetical protein
MNSFCREVLKKSHSTETGSGEVLIFFYMDIPSEARSLALGAVREGNEDGISSLMLMQVRK